MTSVLCVDNESNYFKIDGLDLWTRDRDAYLFTGCNPVIVHPPCQQWSRLRSFAKVNQVEKDLAVFCFELVLSNGGIFEHPSGSSFFKFVGYRPTISIDQSWFGFPARKRTYLFFNGFRPGRLPLNFNAIEKTVDQLAYKSRSRMPLTFCQWLVDCVST